ncbi:MAG: serine/threonine protein kinase [Planctomycetaceae bacterium]|nr:serine/threonine protein kinase [Planctomycetaceae bacterium]
MNSNNPSAPDRGDEDSPTRDSPSANGVTSTSQTHETQAIHGGSTATNSLIGSRVGDYQVMRKLGRGGMADVYVARQVSLGREVALKVLRSDYARDQDYVKRFRREARAAANLNHPNIVQVIDVGNAGTNYFIAQELVDGENLRQTLDAVGTVSLEDAIEVLVGVAAALEVASEAGITHRDIKPENIMRTSRGIIKVADFGLARLGTDVAATKTNLTQAGLTLGTPRYMSPEQVQGKPVDVRSDLYSLGVTLYHLLAGRPPFEADDPLALALMHLHEPPPPLDRVRGRTDDQGTPDLPEWLIAVVTRLMEKIPGDRFQSPSELLDAVRNETATSNLGGYGVGTAAATIRLQRATDYQQSKRRNQHRKIAVAILLPSLAIAAASVSMMNSPMPSVSDVLNPDVAPQQESVQAQYLYAIRRNDEAAWRSVGEFFPPEENATNASYFAKSIIQLANQMSEDGHVADASRTLDQLLRSANVDRVYQAIALARQYFVLEKLGKKDRQAVVKREFQSLYQDLQTNNPNAQELIDATLGFREIQQLGVSEN